VNESDSVVDAPSTAPAPAPPVEVEKKAAKKPKKTVKAAKKPKKTVKAAKKPKKNPNGKWPGGLCISMKTKIFNRFERARKAAGKARGLKKALSRSAVIEDALEVWLRKAGY
jgi:hypothetical protein